MQEISDELIDNFFRGLCTKEEAVMVLDFLKKNPEHPYLLNEWNNTDGKTPLPAHTALEMYDEVAAHISVQGKTDVKLLWRVAAAACVIGLFISLLFIGVTGRKNIEPAATDYVKHTEWIERQNTQDTSIVLQLADASRVTLSPGAYIRYSKDFGQLPRRDIYMTGDAYYEVSKNKEKPFTVYSGYISTTALGTAFRVTAMPDKNGISVRLNEGKVVVKVTDTGYKKMHPDYYLLPGEEIAFRGKNMAGIIRPFNKKNSAVKAAEKNIVAHYQGADESYMFNNQTLADVLDQLAAIYHVSIEYSKDDIGKIYFIGRIERDDSIEKTIQDIALLNKLSVKKQNGGYILKRKKH